MKHYLYKIANTQLEQKFNTLLIENPNILESIYEQFSSIIFTILNTWVADNKDVSQLYDQLITLWVNMSYNSIITFLTELTKIDFNGLPKQNIIIAFQNSNTIMQKVYDEYNYSVRGFDTNDYDVPSISTLEQLITMNDSAGDYYYTTSKFTLDKLINRDYPWIYIDNQIIYGQKLQTHTNMAKQYITDNIDNTAYEKANKSKSPKLPFAFGYTINDAAIIDGTIGSPPPNITTVKNELMKKFNRIYYQPIGNSIITRLAKKIHK